MKGKSKPVSKRPISIKEEALLSTHKKRRQLASTQKCSKRLESMFIDVRKGGSAKKGATQPTIKKRSNTSKTKENIKPEEDIKELIQKPAFINESVKFSSKRHSTSKRMSLSKKNVKFASTKSEIKEIIVPYKSQAKKRDIKQSQKASEHTTDSKNNADCSDCVYKLPSPYIKLLTI